MKIKTIKFLYQIWTSLILMSFYLISGLNSTEEQISIETAMSTEAPTNSYPIHDAIIASGFTTLYGNPSSMFTLSEIWSLFDCSGYFSENMISSFLSDIPTIIDKAIGRYAYDSGRVLEKFDQVFEVGENYQTKVKGTTISCFVTADMDDDSAAAYASYILASTIDAPDPTDSTQNLSMFIEADVMEMPAFGLYFTPKKHCFDGLDITDESSDKWGMTAPMNSGNDPSFIDTIPNPLGNVAHKRRISLGTKEGVLHSNLNRLSRLIAWPSKRHEYRPELKKDWKTNLVLSAYAAPKSEIWALPKILYPNNPCRGLNVTYDEDGIYYCVYMAISNYSKKYGLSSRYLATMDAAGCFFGMKEYLHNWQNYVRDEKEEMTDEEVQELFSHLNETSLDLQIQSRQHVMFPVPYIFDRNIALQYKNSEGRALQVNPFSIGANISFSSNFFPWEVCTEENTKSIGVIAAAYSLDKSVKRRLNEFRGVHMSNISDWKLQNDPFYGDQIILNGAYFDQNISWNNNGNLLPGNLTKKILGRTAKWMMVTSWEDTSDLQNLVDKVLQEDAPYSNVVSAVYDPGNPCSEFAANEDIFLFLLAIALAGFGAVNAVVIAMHQGVHWWTITCCGTAEDQQLMRNHTSPGNRSAWMKCFITYEVLLVVLGTAAFVGLYIPMIVQIKKEFEIANFRTEELALDVNYGESPISNHVVYGLNQPVLITLIHAETQCENSRPWLLLNLLIFFTLVNVCINAPYIKKAIDACKRCCAKLRLEEWDDGEGFSVYSGELFLLKGPTPDEFVPGSSIRHSVHNRLQQRRSMRRQSNARRPSSSTQVYDQEIQFAHEAAMNLSRSRQQCGNN